MAKRKLQRGAINPTSQKINEFIKANAHLYPTWQDVADAIFEKLGARLSMPAVARRGNTLGARPAGRHTRPVPQVVVEAGKDPLQEAIRLHILKRKGPHTVLSLADAIDASPARVRKALDGLKADGHNVVIEAETVELSSIIPKADPSRINVKQLGGKVYRFGFVTDNHLASKHERLDVLNALYDVFEAEGITTVYQGGNMIEGDARFNKHEVIVTGLEAQASYCAAHWPKRDGITTYFVTGDDHEGWYVQREGVDVGRYIENCFRHAGRDDFKYVGHMEHDFIFKGTKTQTVLRLIHAGGGSSYATSYAAQKIVESYQGGEKPHVLLIGHYHKAEYGYPREVHCVQGGCTVDQTSFMRKKKLQAHVGGWIVEMTLHPEGHITRFRQEWIPFYDKGFYNKAWKYPDLTPPPALTQQRRAA
jgi:hypothetical protein